MSFSPAAFQFLRSLKRNNRREWFTARRELFETELRAPLRQLLEELDVQLATRAPEFVADPKRSPFRIHRDIRFSKDKSPYKTSLSFWVNHRALGGTAGSVVHGGAGLYFHFEPGRSLVAAGIWMPPPAVLVQIRRALLDDTAAFERALRALRPRFGPLDDEGMLRRPPRGYPTSHLAARWLRYKSFTVSAPLPDAELRRPDLAVRLARSYARAIPFVRWLNAALGYPPAARR
jgi:uncharacterized protein (TIGR02453 family)